MVSDVNCVSDKRSPAVQCLDRSQQKIPCTSSSAPSQFLLCKQTSSCGGSEVPLGKGLPGTQWLSNRSGCNYNENSVQKPSNTSCLLWTLWRTRKGKGTGWMADVKLPVCTALLTENRERLLSADDFCLLMTSFQLLSRGFCAPPGEPCNKTRHPHRLKGQKSCPIITPSLTIVDRRYVQDPQ